MLDTVVLNNFKLDSLHTKNKLKYNKKSVCTFLLKAFFFGKTLSEITFF